jgi:hypothetical protein
MTDYPNWFNHYAVRFFERHLSPLAGKPGLRFLQIGAFTGDASVWLLENILTGKGSFLVDVDTWEGSDEPEHEPFDWADLERTYDRRTSGWQPASYCSGSANAWLVKFKGTSEDFFLTPTPNEYDFIYIDGDHTAPAVLNDAVGALRALKPGGLLAFDDYLWKSIDGVETKSPGVAVDAFAAVYADEIEILETGLQVWFRKTTDRSL